MTGDVNLAVSTMTNEEISTRYPALERYVEFFRKRNMTVSIVDLCDTEWSVIVHHDVKVTTRLRRIQSRADVHSLETALQYLQELVWYDKAPL